MCGDCKEYLYIMIQDAQEASKGQKGAVVSMNRMLEEQWMGCGPKKCITSQAMLLHPRNSTRPWSGSSISSRPVSKCTDHNGSISGRVGNQVWLDRCWQKVEGGAAVNEDRGVAAAVVLLLEHQRQRCQCKECRDQAHSSRNGNGKGRRGVTERRKEGGGWAGVTRQEGMGSRRDGIDRLDCQGQNKAFLSFSGSEQIDSKKQREREERKGEISFARTSRPCMGQLCGSVADKANSRCASFVSVTPGKKKAAKFWNRDFSSALENLFSGILVDFWSPSILTKTRCSRVNQLHLWRHVGTYIQLHIHKYWRTGMISTCRPIIQWRDW